MARKRRNIAFSLSFLDIMACGFGAVTLLFLILRHNAVEIVTPDIKTGRRGRPAADGYPRGRRRSRPAT